MNIHDKTKEELINELKELLHERDSLKALIARREAEFLLAHDELLFQNKEKEKRAAELIIANKELLFQNEEKEKRAAELVIADKELDFQNEEKEKRAAELVIADKELLFQNEEKEKRAAELILAQEIAEEFEEKFRQISENVDEVFWLRTHSEMIYVSPSFEKIWGVPDQEIYKNPQIFTETIHPDDIPIVRETIQSSEFKVPGLFNYEYRIVQPNNQVRWINSKSFPILDESGKIVKRVGIAKDITDKYQSVQELVKAMEKAENSDRLKSAFLANMSHEIRTPMNGILGFAELLKEPELKSEKQQEYIKIIEKSGKRMLNIINNIVDISKIESGLMKLDISEYDINEQIKYVYTFFKPEVEAKGLKLSYKTPLPAKEAIVYTDREKVYAILTNLVKNAIKFTAEGSIEFGYVSTDLATSTGSEPADNVSEPASPVSELVELKFYVKDTGIGIPKDKQDAIFERFIQADIEDRKARQGTGLGLAISKSYVNMLGGEIWVESEDGVGSTFYFTLPRNTKTEENTVFENVATTVEADNPVKNLKILIVEDDKVSEMLLTLFTDTFSKDILKARTGLDAVETCRNNPEIDLILMDIQMPDMNGYEATRKIREFNKDVIIIAQTSYGLAGDSKKATDAGCNDYILKPIKKADFLSMIKKYFTI